MGIRDVVQIPECRSFGNLVIAGLAWQVSEVPTATACETAKEPSTKPLDLRTW